MLFADPKTEEELEWIDKLLPEAPVSFCAPAEDDGQAFYSLLSQANAIVTRRREITERMLEAAPQLRLIQRYGTRWDGIDLQAAQARGIVVATMPLHGAIAVAELAITLILALSKNLLRAHRETAGAKYRDMGVEPIRTDEHTYKFNWVNLPGIMEVYGKRLGIIGFGEIGTETSRRARALGMQVSYNKRTRLPEAVEHAEEATYCTKDELLRESDFVLLSTPLTQETQGMIGARELGLMKPSAYLINVSKGGVIDERALVAALRQSTIAGAGLDVFVYEPLPFDHPLLKCENVILTPHIGGGTAGAREKQMRAVLGNIRHFIEEGSVRHRVV